MGKELLLVAEAVCNEKGVKKEVVFEAICAALESATKKKRGVEWDVKVNMDHDTGEYTTCRRWIVVNDEDFVDENIEISLTEANIKNSDLQLGEYIVEDIPSVGFGRIAAQAAKQVIIQKVREAERKLIVEAYEEKVDTLITAVVKKTFREGVILDLGGHAEALLEKNNMLSQDLFRIGDRVRAYLYKVETKPKGPQLFVSRTHTNMLVELFKIEVPEIGEDIIEIKSSARDAGSRSKIAVKTNDGRIDPIGACVGMRGSRVQAVSGELCGERIDIILWDGDDLQMVVNALSPAEVVSIVIDEETRAMDLAVKEEQLAQVIGRNGQNVRLASKLTGWILNIMSEEEFANKSNQENEKLVDLFKDKLEIDESKAKLLVENGFSSMEEVAYVPEDELSAIENCDAEVLLELRNKAQNILLTSALVSEEKLDKLSPTDELIQMEGIGKELAYILAGQGILTVEDLAECSIDEIVDKVDIDREKASNIILKAREPWFADCDNEG